MSEAAQQLAEISGVVHPPGAGGGRSGQESLWTLTFELQPWRRPDGVLDERRLWVRQPNLSEEALEAGMETIHPYELVRLRVRLADEPAEGEDLSAELVEMLGNDLADAELVRCSVELQQPVTVEAPFFGTLTLDRSLNWYEKTVEWNGSNIQLYLSRDECVAEAELFHLAGSLWRDQAGWEARVRDYAVEELLELKNDTWLDDDEAELTPEQFRERMRLESIVVYPDGRFEFTYDDGDLFWGHVIQVSGTLSEGPTDAGIAG